MFAAASSSPGVCLQGILCRNRTHGWRPGLYLLDYARATPVRFAGEEIAKCPSCSLFVRVIYDPQDFQQPAGLEA